MKTLKTVLLIEDNRGDARLIREMFRDLDPAHAIELSHVECLRDALTYLSARQVDLVLLDLGLSGCVGARRGAARLCHRAARAPGGADGIGGRRAGAGKAWLNTSRALSCTIPRV